MQSQNHLDDDKVKHELFKQGYEFINTSKRSSHSIEVDAKKLHPVIIEKNDTLNIPVPVSLVVTFDKDNHIINIEESTVSPEVIKDAEKYVRTLFENNQIDGLNNHFNHNTTHKIEVNDKGQKVIMRTGYRSF